MRPGPLALLFLLAGSSAIAQLPTDSPIVAGYVTHVSAEGAFEIDGVHVRIAADTRIVDIKATTHTLVHQLDPVYLGQPIRVWGHLDRKSHSLDATFVEQTLPSPATVTGAAMIDLAPAGSPGGVHIVRADGFLLKFTPDSRLAFNPPLTAINQLSTNLWIEYRGVQQTDGTVIVSAAEVWPNVVTPSEDKLRTEREFDPSEIDEGDAQSGLSKAFHGIDVRRLPAHRDDALQSRIDRIGQSLIPAYQKALPVTDLSRINFRFQVVDTNRFRDAIAFANGIILVPYSVVARLEGDSQIAAILADNIAASLEKQEILHQPAEHRMAAANIAGEAAGIFVPGLSLATGLSTYGVEKHAITMHRRQSGRVALWYMHDAGYDLSQAPIAWWLLEPAKAKPLEQIHLPDRAAYLYSVLGTTWSGDLSKKSVATFAN